MKKEELYRFVDHTALKAVTTWKEIQQLCQEARFFRMASVCIPSSYVKRAHEYFPELNICTVVGFPLGNANTEAKLMETRQALADGASEIDMVINLGMVKNRQYPLVTEEIRLLKQEVGDKILKVIIETCLLTEEEKIKMCEIVTEAGADFIKTSTGFSTSGATFDDIALFKKYVGENVKIKAAGGITDFNDAREFVLLGADRLGTSRLVEQAKKKGGDLDAEI